MTMTTKDKVYKNTVPVIGVTGGVGAGKSTLLSYLSDKYGAHIIMADEISRHLQQPGEECWKNIVRSFGEGILNPDGTLNRSELADIVYNDRSELEKLNAIMHPAVKESIMQEILSAGKNFAENKIPFAVIEAALLLEDHYNLICDKIWYIYAPEQIRMSRLISSRGYSAGKASMIMRNQHSDEEFRLYCDTVIDNSSEDPESMYIQTDRAVRSI